MIIPKPKFPNIPQLPGVPQLLRSPLFPASAAKVLTAGLGLGNLLQSLLAPIVWGAFDANGKLMIQPDSVVDFGYRNAFQISNFPVQRGKFASYNKVASGFEILVRMTKGGTQKQRDDFLTSIELVINDLLPDSETQLPLYTVMTPERSYLNVTMMRYEHQRRGTQGAYFLDVDTYWQEIRQVDPQFSSMSASTQNAQDPSALPPQNRLRVQPEPPGLADFDPGANLS